MSTDWASLENKLAASLNEDRFRHTLGVTYTACALAMRYGADTEKARMAGLLHDCAKCIPNKKKIELCRKKKIRVTEFEIEHPVLLHAKLGTYVAETDYGIHDPEVLSAIEWHTTGRPSMTLLEKIIFTADYIEPNRDKAPRLNDIRREAFTDLNRCLEMILGDTVTYLSRNPKSMDPMTLEAWKYYRSQDPETDRKQDDLHRS